MSDAPVKQKTAILSIEPHVLARLLELPDGSVIDRVWQPNDELQGNIRVRVVGFGHEVPDGALIPKAHGIVSQEIDAGGNVIRRSLKWVV